MQDEHRAIAEHAHRLWEARGRPTGADEEIWLEAERLFRAKQSRTEQSATPATKAHESSLAIDNSLRDSFPASDPPANSLPDEPAANLDEKWRAAGIKRTEAPAPAANGAAVHKKPPQKKNKASDPPPGLISIDGSIDELARKAVEEARQREQAKKLREQTGRRIDPAK